MKTNPTQPLRHLLDRAQKRFIRSRPGSVLILVVALLVMMALIGTAYMTMAQFDRGTAIIHSFNTEVDLLLDGIVNQVKGTIVNDDYTNGQFRQAVNFKIAANNVQTPVTYDTPLDPTAPRSWNGYDLGRTDVPAGDWWLSSRVPGLPTDYSQNPGTVPAGPNNPPWWPFVSGPINGGAVFDQPYWPPTNSNANTGPKPTPLAQHIQLVPTFTQVNGQQVPAFLAANSGGGLFGISNASIPNLPWMAADTDGDGIADAGLVKLLTLDGVTYYAAVRIVDNSAAINASIAEVPNPATSFVAGTTMPGDLSPVNIDLAGLIVPPTGGGADDLFGPRNGTGGPGLLTNFRWNGRPVPSQVVIADPPAPPPPASPVPPPPYQRTDFSFPTDGGLYFNAQWFQLGRRLRNPGFVARGVRYQALPISEDLTMARGFVLRDPSVPNSTLSSSVLEQRMPNTLFIHAPTSPYVSTPSATNMYPYPVQWFEDSFDYLNEYVPANPPTMLNYLPKRALIVGQNPVSNFAPARFNMNTSAYTSFSQYQFGDVANVNGWKYVCISSNPGTGPLPLDQHWQDPNWAWEPWTNAPTKTSVNTGTFQQLYAAYWAVMADQYTPPVVDPVTGAITTPGQWQPAFPNPSDTGGQTYRMFRNPIRDGYVDSPLSKPTLAQPGLIPQQTMQLRAAIAAVNTMGLRHGSKDNLASFGTNDVISRTISLNPPTGSNGIPLNATVYSVERQPYITQVFAINDADSSNDWVAVELYNPYPDPIALKGWMLATIDRRNAQQLTLAPLGGSAGDLSAQATGFRVIKGHERVVLMSNTTPPSTINFTTSANPTGTPPTEFYQCPGLVDSTNGVFDKELILLRPRRADGNTMKSNPSNALNNIFGEEASGNGLNDLVPIDSYDFTNFDATAAKNIPPQVWWYRRPNADANDSTAIITATTSTYKQWHFVFPGPWKLASTNTGNGPPQPGGPGKQPTWSGTLVINPNNGQNTGQIDVTGLGAPVDTPNPPDKSLGTVPPANYQDTAIEVNAVDFGPNKPSSTSMITNTLPLGGFARDGDILQVTYIGSYKIWTGTSDTSQTVLEMNPITVDSAMATACDARDASNNKQEPIVSDGRTPGTPQIIAENIGHFCPIDRTDAAADPSATTTLPIDDFAQAPVGNSAPLGNWRYHWATRLFDFLSVQSPQDDYLPNVDPWMDDYSSSQYRYLPATSGAPQNVPTPVPNGGSGANSGLLPASPTPALAAPSRSEDTAPVDGLINVNTANWRVLATIPWIPASYPDFRMQNARIAMAIVDYRDVNDPDTPGKPHGPFRNLFELGEAHLRLPQQVMKPLDRLPWPPPKPSDVHLRDILMEEPPSTTTGLPITHANANAMAFNQQDGNLAPLTANVPAVVTGDFLAQFNTITRISNLVTFRSDSFTAYILIQGWRNAETQNPSLVVQRRTAVIIDRSNVTPTNRSPNAVNVPMN